MSELTVGQKACGVSFNPSEREDVTAIKKASAHLIDVILESMRDEGITPNSLAEVLLKSSIVKVVEAQSNAVRILFLDQSLKG